MRLKLQYYEKSEQKQLLIRDLKGAEMALKANELRRGQALIWEGQLQVVIGTEFVKPGKGPAYIQVKMKSVSRNQVVSWRVLSPSI